MGRTIITVAALAAALLLSIGPRAEERDPSADRASLEERLWDAEVQRDASILLRSQAESQLGDAERELTLATTSMESAAEDLRLARWRMDRAWIAAARTRLQEARGEQVEAQEGVEQARALWRDRDLALARAQDLVELLNEERIDAEAAP